MQLPPLMNPALSALASLNHPVRGRTKVAKAAPSPRSVEQSKNDRLDAEREFFGARSLYPTEFKADLFERIGTAFGFGVDQFESRMTFGNAVREQIEQIMLKPNGSLHLYKVEEKLGLHQLGLSLDDVVRAMIEQGSVAEARLDAMIASYIAEKPGMDSLEDPGLYGRRAFILDS